MEGRRPPKIIALAVETAIGYVPKAEDINIDGLDDFSLDTLKGILAVDKDAWKVEEPVDVEELRLFVYVNRLAHIEPVLEVVAHMISAERTHCHRIALPKELAKQADELKSRLV